MNHFPHISHAACTDVGRKRKNNEDAYGEFPDAGIYCVADGMGGGDDGEIASSATVRAVEVFVRDNPLPDGAAYALDQYIQGLSAAVNKASAWIQKRARDKSLKGCGSTFVALCLDPSHPGDAVAVHAGDSRLYRIRGKSIQQITRDHSAAEYIGAKSEADVNPMFRGMILRAVGIDQSVALERTPFEISKGDRVVICSDGLSRMLSDKTMLGISRENPDCAAASKALVAAANEAGGVDNVTAVVVDIGALPAALSIVPMQGDAHDAAAITESDDDSGTSSPSQTQSTDYGKDASSRKETGPTATDSVFGCVESNGKNAISVAEDDSDDTADSTPSAAQSQIPSASLNWMKLTLIAIALVACIAGALLAGRGLRSQSEDHDAELKSLSEKMIKMAADFELQKKEFLSQIKSSSERYEAQLQDKDSELQRSGEREKALARELNESKENLSAGNASIAAKEEEIRRLGEQLSKNGKSAESDAVKLKSEIESLKSDVAGFKTRAEKAEAAQKRLEAEKSEDAKQIGDTKAALAAAQATVQTVTNERDDLMGKLTEAQTNCRNVESERDALKSDCDKLKSQIAGMKSKESAVAAPEIAHSGMQRLVAVVADDDCKKRFCESIKQYLKLRRIGMGKDTAERKEFESLLSQLEMPNASLSREEQEKVAATLAEKVRKVANEIRTREEEVTIFNLENQKTENSIYACGLLREFREKAVKLVLAKPESDRAQRIAAEIIENLPLWLGPILVSDLHLE